MNTRNAEGWTPLMISAKKNKNPSVIQALIKSKGSVHDRKKHAVNAGDSNSWVPLMFAVKDNQKAQIVQTLLVAGADAKAK